MNENKFAKFLKLVSVGKYQTKLYYGDKKGEYSTISGGIITISFTLVLLATSINILIQTFRRENYTLTSEYVDIVNTNLL